MKVSIIVFSPGGNTLKVAEKLKQLAPNKEQVQILNITGNEEIFTKENVNKYLNENLEPHDLLLIGSPVYAHHIQYHVIDMMKNLPKPGWKFGKFAASFVSFGDVSSGIALNEANQLLRKTGRKVVGGLKITAEHTLTRLLDEPINLGKPGDEINELIRDFWNKIDMRMNKEYDIQQLVKSMNYQPIKDRMKVHVIFREKIWQKYLYPKIQINHDKCAKCGLCLKNCPVNHLQIEAGQIIETKSSPCITCGNCVVNCSKNAISMTGNIDKFAEMIKDYKNGKSKIASNE